jgi:hypothetical protein
MLLGFSWLYAQLSGTYNITGNPTPGPGEFTTIQDAFNALMSQGVGPGGVTFVVQESWRTTNSSTGRDAEPSTIQLSTYPGAGSRPVTLTFSGLSDTVYFAKAPTNTGRFIFRFTGSVKYFTLDGAGKLILKSTATGPTSTGLIGFVSVGTTTPLDIDAITIQNVVMHGNGRGNTYAGIYIGDDGTLGTAVSTASNIGTGRGVTMQGCTIDSVSRPILVAGRRINTQNIRVIQDTLGNPTDPTAWAADDNNIGAVHLRGVQNPIVRGCVVHGEENDKHSIAGIRLDSCQNFTITQNWVYNIRYTGTDGYGSYGIFISLPSTFMGSSSVNNVVSNNMLAGLSGDGDVFSFPRYIPAGIFVETASGTISDAKLALIHNSIHLFGSASGRFTGGSAGIAIRSGVQGGVRIDGNLIQNTFDASGNDVAYGLVIATGSPSTARFDIDYNQYYLGGSASQLVYARVGTNLFTTFSGWQLSNIPNIPSPDANGLVHVPGPVPFVSNTDLHLVSTSPSSAINAGNIAYRGAPDFDGETRPLPDPPGSSVNNPQDPGTAPDVGADELDGTPFSCPSSLQAPDIVVTGTYPPLAGSEYLWGQQVEIDTTGTNSPPPSGTLNLIYSLNGGTTWIPGPTITSFPFIFTLPPVTPPYTPTMLIAVEATAPSICPPLQPDRSDNPASINVTDRLGNRADNAILITLTPDPDNPGHWIAPLIADSTSGPGLSNEYVDPTPGAFNDPRGRPTRDLFFKITLPECLDSLDVSLCSITSQLLSDTYLHLINATVQDTIDSDDGCSAFDIRFRSEIRALGLPNVLGHNPTSNVNAKPARDTLLLVSGHELYIVVEGYNSDGKFELQVKGYKIRPSSINVTGAPSGPVCINSNPITLDATTPGATAYLWLDAYNNPIATGPTYIFDPNTEGIFPVTVEVSFDSPNGDPISCAPDVLTESVTITVEDIAQAQIADASNTPISNSTLTINEGSDVTLTVSSPQATGNAYTWNLYNSIPPSGTPTTSTGSSLTINNISAGDYTVILEAVRGTGACGTTQDIVYLNVTTGLRTDAGTFSIFPNPNTGAFTIVAPAMDTYRIQVLDVAGRLVAEDAFTGSTHQMRVSLPAGIYQVRLIAGEKVQVGRLIITE